MNRLVAVVLLIACAAPVGAKGEPPYYGPGKPWHGIGYKFGYMEHVEKDGSWRIDVRVRNGDAINMAMYRAAERARDAGYRYVQFLRGTEQVMGFGFGSIARGGGRPTGFATVWARPAAGPDAPTQCPHARFGSCYTAEVAAVLRILGGPNGNEPGVAIVDHYDRFGRAVLLSGFGVGAADARAGTSDRGRVNPPSRGSAAGAVPIVMAASAPVPTGAAARSRPQSAADEAQARFDAARRAEQPVRGDVRQGWSASD